MSIGPAIYEGKIRFVSISAMERFDERLYGGCNRKYWFRYKARRKEKPTKGAKLGDQCHSQLEHYLKTGEDVLGEIVRAGRRFIPEPLSVKPGLEVELAFGKPMELLPGGSYGPIESPLMAGDVPVIGKIDVLNTRGEWIDDEGVKRQAEDEIEIIDWKNLKQIDDDIDPDTGICRSKGYAKKSGELLNGWQFVGYATVAQRFVKTNMIRVSHGNFQTQGQRTAAKRSLLVATETIDQRWSTAPELISRMKVVAATEKVEDVKANYSACRAYGGCQHEKECPRAAKEILATLFGGKAMSLMNRMNAKKSPEVAKEVENLKQEEKAIKAGILPKDTPKPEKIAEPLPEGSSEAIALEKVKEGTLKKDGSGQVYDKEGADTPSECESGKTITCEPDVLVSKKYDCSCGETVKVKPQKMPDGIYQALVPKHRISVKVEEEAPPPEAPKEEIFKIKPIPCIDRVPDGLSLYLDASEDGVKMERLETYADKIAAALCETYHAADLRCAPKDSPLAFAGWRGALAGMAKAEPPPPGYYSVSSSSEFGLVVFEALAPMARRVIRGGGR